MIRGLLGKTRYTLQGVLALLAITANTIFFSTAILLLAVFKFLAPRGRVRNLITHYLSALGESWISINKVVLWFYRRMQWDVDLPDKLERNGRYLVFCNHQSWVDILVLQHCLNRKAPFKRFLLKQELIWVPFLGYAWWALDMAFLRRYSRQALIKSPALRGKDLENAARACEKLKHIPVSMMAFPEGTRFTPAKRLQQKSPYQHLLRPRHGGIGQILYSFGDAMQELIDVTIFYPEGAPSFWQFVSGQVGQIELCARVHHIDAGIRGKDFRSDNMAKQQLKKWLKTLWEDKDRTLCQAIRQTQESTPESKTGDPKTACP